MTRHLQCALVVVFSLAAAGSAAAQDAGKEKPPASAPKPAPAPVVFVPLKTHVVIGRYQGDKKISSMPYDLSMNAGGHASLRMGSRIPIVMLAMTNMPKDAPAGGPVQYQDVGTNIDCFSTEGADGRYLLNLTIDDTSVYPEDQQAAGTKGNPSFRSFRATNALTLKNGETGQFTAATDKVTGETVRVDVTLTVVR